MRNPKRLDKFYTELCELHKKYVPDWRFGQLVSNYANDTGRDIFFDEEDNTLKLIEEWLIRICKKEN
jgi:hypothetical protein